MFFKKKKDASEDAVQTIRPVVIRTENVAKELMNVAQSNGISPAMLDFNLLEVQTMKRMGEEEWEELSSDEVSRLGHDNLLLDPGLDIKQIYEIEVFSKAPDEMLDPLDIGIGANSTMCKVYMTIKAGSKATYFDGFEEALTKLINKKKLRAKLMLWIFDDPMQATLKELSAKVRVNETVTFEEAETYLIAEGMEPVPTVDDALILHYEKKKKHGGGEGDRVDYSKRGYLVSVVENELLIEYVKARAGEPGRNCRGEFMAPKEPVVANEPDFNISEKIDRIESDERTEFRAKKSGYVTFENNTYDINSEMDVTEISFKTTGSIETELNADVSINVKETDVFKDAIGMGMEVEVNEINIDGNIGSGSKVRANKATIEGQTHQSSEVYADDLRINIHKGKASGKKVHITRLEHGTVEGESVTVKQAIGGKIRAREITVEILGSHVTMTATEKIEVQQLKGSENRFIIDPVVLQGSQDELSKNEDQIREAKRHITEVEKEAAKYEKLVNDSAASFIDLKKRLIQYKKSGVQMPTSFVKKYKQYQQMQSHLESLKKELAERSERLELLSRRHHTFQSDIFAAKVICHDQWRGHNEIIFKMIEPEIEVSFVPPEFSTEAIYMLHEDEEHGNFYIVPVEEA